MEAKCINKKCLSMMIITFILFGITSYQYIQTHPRYIYVNKDVIEKVFLPPLNTTNIGNKLENKKSSSETSKNILDGCYHVYLDVGSNIGVQVRKLYEPELYPKANVHVIFNSRFGSILERTSQNGN